MIFFNEKCMRLIYFPIIAPISNGLCASVPLCVCAHVCAHAQFSLPVHLLVWRLKSGVCLYHSPHAPTHPALSYLTLTWMDAEGLNLGPYVFLVTVSL